MAEQVVRAVDCGGTGFRRADVSGVSTVDNFCSIPPVKNVDELLNFVCGNLPKETIGVGYALAGVIEGHNRVVKSPNIPFLKGVALGTLTSKRLGGKPTVVCNDMEGSVTGMAALSPDTKTFWGGTWSSGIGLRVFKDGKILFVDCEGGHINIDDSPYAQLCGCGLRGCAEAIVGGHAVKRRVLNETAIRGIEIPQGVHPCAFLDQEFVRNEPWAGDIYEMVAKGMGALLASVITLCPVPVIMWKGTFAQKAIHLIGSKIKAEMARRLIEPKWADVNFYFSPEPENDGLIGAANILRSTLLQKI